MCRQVCDVALECTSIHPLLSDTFDYYFPSLVSLRCCPMCTSHVHAPLPPPAAMKSTVTKFQSDMESSAAWAMEDARE